MNNQRERNKQASEGTPGAGQYHLPGLLGLQLPSQRILLAFVLVFAVLAASFFTAGYFYIASYKASLRKAVGAQLAGDAKMISSELVHYRQERLGDGYVFYNNPSFTRAVQRFLNNPKDAVARETLLVYMRQSCQANHYSYVCLIDTQGFKRLECPNAPELLDSERLEYDEAKADKPVIVDFNRETADGQIHLAVLVPLIDNQDGGRRLGSLILRINPDNYIGPLIKQAELPSKSSEALLYRREKDGAVCLVNLRFKDDAALNLKFLSTQTDRLIIKAARGQEGILDGVDYRGENVIGYVGTIPDTPWLLAVKMDISEMYAPAVGRIRFLIILGLIGLTSAGIIIVLFWRTRSLRYYRERYSAAEKLLASELRFQSTFDQAAVGICHVSPEGTFLRMNQRLCDIVGYSREELTELTFADFTHPDDIRLDIENHDHLLRGDISTYSMEKRYIRKDGSIVWVNLTASLVRDMQGKPEYFISVVEDITERKQAEVEILAIQASLIEAQAIARLGSWEWDIANDILKGSEEFYSLFDVKPEEIARSDLFFGRLHPADRERVQQEVAESVKAKRDYSADYRVRLKDGSWRELSARGRVFLGDDGTPLRLAGTCMDITESKQAEAKILASQASLMETQAIARLGSWEWDIVNDLFTGSEECYRLLGVSPDEIIRLEHVLSLVHPDDLGRVQQNVATFKVNGTPYESEFAVLLKDGSHRNLSVRGLLFVDEEGKPLRAVGSAMDITESKQAEDALRQSERRFVQVAESTGEVIWETDASGLYVYISPACEKVLGYTPDEIVGKMHFYDLFAPEVREQLIAAAFDGFARKATFRDFTNLNVKKDGSIVMLETTGTPILDGEGNLLGYRGADLDVTERKRAEEELLQYQEHLEDMVEERTDELIAAKEAAENASRAKSAFLSNMSHEIRTPMNAVLGYTQILQRDATLSPTQMKYVETIGRSGEFLLSLINDILEMSKIEAGKVTLAPLPMDFQAMLDDLEAMFRVRTAEKNLQFEVSRIGEVPAHIIADPIRVRQVIINMLGNAVKFTGKGGIVVRVFSRKVQGEDRLLVTVEVEDTGMGIPEGELESIFGSFEQTQRGQVIGGTGLGMAISRQLARLMGGDITVQSEVDKGSTFTFTFPAVASPVEEVLVATAPVAAKKILCLAHLPGPRILVVDDKETNRDVLTILLSQIGFTVKEAANGEECIEVFRQWHPQAILMDQRMPVMDGLEATKLIKATPEGESVPILIVTASALEEDRKVALDYGADGFLRKPYKEGELLDELGRLLKLEYVYDEPQDKAPEPHLAEDSFAAEAGELPDDLTSSLLEAAEMGDSTRFAGIVKEQVMPGWPAFGEHLLKLARDYRIDQIVQALKPNEKS